MSALKCKVCGRDARVSPGEWCAQCIDSFWKRMASAEYSSVGFTCAAEWGAKRRAAAAKKAGGK